eukprot:9880857-Alexandrium_andersonii.AAC.1
MSSFHRADDVWHRRFELNDRHGSWIVRLPGFGLDDQVGVRFLQCSDPVCQSIIEQFESEPMPPPDRLSRYLNSIISDMCGRRR